MTDDGAELVSLDGVGFAFCDRDKRTHVLEEISFSIREGEICSIIGRSGIGKSTLLRIIAGHLNPLSGTVQLPDVARGRIPVLFHPQEALLIPWYSVARNAEVGLRFTGLAPTMPLETLFRELELESLEERHPARLSGGQVERAALARTLLTPAAVYLLDEPLSGTDYPLRIRVETFLTAFIAKRRCAAAIVTHDVPQAVAVSDMIQILARRASGASATRIDLPSELRALPPIERRSSREFGPFVQHVVDQLGETVQ